MTTKPAPKELITKQTAGIAGPTKFYNPHVTQINIKSFYNSNTISSNYNQGILIVEGSHATIFANKIDKNIKANIALGGKNCGLSKIKWNLIENSKSEGIFIIEGEEKLLIEGNNEYIFLPET